MSEAQELRRLAEQCLQAARATSNNLVERADLLARAQVWLELAQWLEEQEGQEGLAPPPAASEHAQPPMQQQQQTQPLQPKRNKGGAR